jgi:DNA-nicking Smr family endonuclease
MDNPKLRQLRKALRAKQQITAKPKSKPVETLDDHTLFMRSVHDVTPLKNTQYQHPKPEVSPWPRKQHAEHLNPLDDMTDFWPWDELAPGEELLYSKPGQKLDTLKRLRKGQWPTAGHLDLHGLSSDEARISVTRFLQSANAAGLRCVRIVHGKGMGSKNGEPILKQKLKNWLAQRDEVLAFCQAPQHEGGGGAVLVLIRTRRE